MAQSAYSRRPYRAGIALGVAAACVAAYASPALAQSRYLEPARIDRAVAQFTGKMVGETGGARHRADRRLRLAQCASPLDVAWHGKRGNAVKVTCLDPSGWHIYVTITPIAKAAPAQILVKRGDSVTIAVEGRGFSIRRTALAQQSGAQGDWITVKTSRKSEAINAQVVRPGLVRISL